MKIATYLLAVLFWGVIAAASFMWSKHLTNEKLFNQAVDRAEFVFKMVEATRLWNARHGGVYAVMNEDMQPNPYLHIKNRDINSTNGLELTMINPAYMTRQLVDVVRELSDLRLHITSLKLLNPANTPDEWERRQLERFNAGSGASSEFINKDAKNTFRYMAPLKVNESCLKCHSHQGYNLGDIRGGLSVSFDAKPLVDAEQKQLDVVALLHLLAWIVASVLSVFIVHIIRRNIAELEKQKASVEEIVEERTKDIKKLSYAMESSPASVVITDAQGVIEYVNDKFSEITGYTKDEARGKTPALLHSGKMSKEFYEKLWSTILSKKEWRGEILNRTKGGKEYWESVRISPILGDDGEISNFVAIKEDITKAKLEEEQNRFLARHDALTTLPNRQYFFETLEQCSSKNIALLYLDLDGFKQVNDTLGHNAGDTLLLEVAKRLKSTIRSSDFVARLGGDEFVIIAKSGVSKEGVSHLATKLLDSISKPYDLDGNIAHISVSIGIAFSEGRSDLSQLLECADSAMYKAKEAGRGRFVVCDKE